MEVKAQEKLNNISLAIDTGLKRLEKIKGFLDLLQNKREYKIDKIGLLKEDGKINFNFYWFKLFVRYELEGILKEDSYKRKKIFYNHRMIWGRYDLENNNKIAKDIVKDNLIYEDENLTMFSRGQDHFRIESKSDCLEIIDEIILECIPKSFIHIENESK